MTRPTIKRARVNNLVKWDRGWWHKYTKQARVPQYKSQTKVCYGFFLVFEILNFHQINSTQRLGLCSRSLCAGVGTGLLKTPRTQFKNQAKLHTTDTCLSTFKITTFPHLEHRSNMAEYSIYNCIRYRNVKTRQAYVASCL